MIMRNNKELFLNNVAKSLGRSKVKKEIDMPKWSVYPQDEVTNKLNQNKLVDTLENQCDRIHTKFRKTRLGELPKILKESIEECNGNNIVISNDKRNEEYKLNEFLYEIENEGKSVYYWSEHTAENNISFAEKADIGITFSDITLAESGTVVLFNNKDNGRSLSLLPKTYIAIIPKNTIVPRMTQAVRMIRELFVDKDKVPTCVSFISGPSNSADIEMNLIVGVHGPIRATYIVVDN